MDTFLKLLSEAKKNFRIADHMVFVTYKLVDDSRLLLSSMKNIFKSLSYSMDSLLYFERSLRIIAPVPKNFSSRFVVFRDHCVKRYKLSQKHLYLIKELHSLLLEHEKSPVEFSRKDKFIICSDNYRMKTITLNQYKCFWLSL